MPAFPQALPVKTLIYPIFFNLVERSGNYFLDDDKPLPLALRARVISYALWAYKAFYRKCGRINFGGAHWIGNQKL